MCAQGLLSQAPKTDLLKFSTFSPPCNLVQEKQEPQHSFTGQPLLMVLLCVAFTNVNITARGNNCKAICCLPEGKVMAVELHAAKREKLLYRILGIKINKIIIKSFKWSKYVSYLLP